MSTDLDTRLRGLTELSAATRPPLGADELHQRASRNQRQAVARRAIPAAIVVLALLAGAIAIRSQGSSPDVLVSPPEVTETTEANGLSEQDQKVVDLAKVTTALAGQIDREMLLSSTYAATGGAVGEDELRAQRAATDEADAAYRDALAEVDEASVPAEVSESVKQSLNRLERLDTNRRSVDEFQTDPLGLLDSYANTNASLVDVTMRLALTSDSIELMRPLLTNAYAGVTAAHGDRTAAILTISVEARFYAEWFQGAPGPRTPVKGACGDDPEGAKDQCPAFWDALQSNVDRDQAEAQFLSLASGSQKQWYRAADAGSDYDTLKASVFEDGIGINDLTGTVDRSVPIDPVEWRAAALQRLDRFAAFQQQLLDSIGEPVPEPTLSPGGGTAAVPSPTVTLTPATETTIPAPTTTER